MDGHFSKKESLVKTSYFVSPEYKLNKYRKVRETFILGENRLTGELDKDDLFSDWLEQNHLQDLKPHELNEQHIWNYRVFLSRTFSKASGEPLKRSTQNYYLIALRNLLLYFTDHDIVSLPADKIKLLRDKKGRSITFLTLDQLKKLLSAPNTSTTTGMRDRAILESFFSTGLRIAELVSLNREQLKIDATTTDLEISITGKGGRIRTVYFSQRAIAALRDYLKTRRDKESALFISYRGPRGTAGQRLSPRSIENIVKRYAIQSGCPVNTTPHVLRHSFATDLLEKGVDIRIVQEFLGHQNIATTQVYTHVTSKRLRDIHRKFHSDKELE